MVLHHSKILLTIAISSTVVRSSVTGVVGSGVGGGGIGISTGTVDAIVVPAGVVTVSAEVLLSSLLILGLTEDADGQSDQNKERLKKKQQQ